MPRANNEDLYGPGQKNGPGQKKRPQGVLGTSFKQGVLAYKQISKQRLLHLPQDMLRVCALLALATAGQCYIAPASFLPSSRSVSTALFHTVVEGFDVCSLVVQNRSVHVF